MQNKGVGIRAKSMNSYDKVNYSSNWRFHIKRILGKSEVNENKKREILGLYFERDTFSTKNHKNTTGLLTLQSLVSLSRNIYPVCRIAMLRSFILLSTSKK